jgi:hypothetical protein
MGSPTSHHAAHAVLNTNELLCNIIIRLPMDDIVVATGVSKSWRKALKENVAIQQAMFLTPVDVRDIMSEVDCLSMNIEDIPRDQLILIEKIHSRFFDFWECSMSAGSRGVSDSFQRSFTKHSSGLWRDMFATQPPIRTFTVEIEWKKKEYNCETGVKMGELYDFCQSLLELQPTVVGADVAPEGFDKRSHPHRSQGGLMTIPRKCTTGTITSIMAEPPMRRINGRIITTSTTITTADCSSDAHTKL